MPLPYPGYSWSFTQHAIAYEPVNLFGLLRAAATWNGREPERDGINALLEEEGVLTLNIRQNRPDAWRDYQQVLAELGFIHSTALIPVIRLTEIGDAVLDGLIGYSEAITTQALRYQYPNGFKDDVSERLRQELDGTPFRRRESLIDLQAGAGVLVKPGVLMVRTLLGLHGQDPVEAYLTTDEIQQFLVGVFHFNQEVPDPDVIIANRRRPARLPLLGRRRNVQDWMRLMSRTDVCMRTAPSAIGLSPRAVADQARLQRLLDYHASAESFWVPVDAMLNSRLGWFEHFGSINLASQWNVDADELTPEYQRQNYLAGRDDDGGDQARVQDEPQPPLANLGGIGGNLRNLPPLPPRQAAPTQFIAPDAAALAAARTRAEKSARLHATMVQEIGDVFRARGVEVFEDPNSVDLLLRRQGAESIVEVKTVNLRNVVLRVRLGVGQLFEYQYRREGEIRQRPSLALALSSDVPGDDPVIRYLNDHLSIALIARSGEGRYSAYRPVAGTPLDVL